MSIQCHLSHFSKQLWLSEDDNNVYKRWESILKPKAKTDKDCNFLSKHSFNIRFLIDSETDNDLKIGTEKWERFLESLRESLSVLGKSVQSTEQSKSKLTFSKEFLNFLKINKVVIPEDQIFDTKDFVQLINSFLLFLLLQSFNKIDAHQNYLSFYKNLIANFLPLIFYTIRNFSIQKNLSISA